MQASDENIHSIARRVGEVFIASAKLGATSFGGPIAHISYFHQEYVVKRRWIREEDFADLVALCQFLPGPASSQLGIAIGLSRAGLLGGFAAWVGFTLPSAVLLVVFAALLRGFSLSGAGWLHGLTVVAVAVVAQAVLVLGKSLASDRARASIAGVALVACLIFPTRFTQIAVIVAAALSGWLLFRSDGGRAAGGFVVPVGRRTAAAALFLFALLLVALPLVRLATGAQWIALADSFYRSGALVFGGGHVVLPLLQREVVPTGWIGNADFLAGYGAAQAIPGPLFTFAAYLGYLMRPAPNGVAGAAIALGAIFLPAFLLVVGILPLWASVKRSTGFRSILSGINASIVGVLAAALYNPVWTSAVHTAADFALAATAFILLFFWKARPWMVVLLGAAVGQLLAWML